MAARSLSRLFGNNFGGIRSALASPPAAMPCSTEDPASSPSKRLKASGPEEPSQRLRFAKLSENALAPSRGSSKAAGYDLYSAYDYEIPASGKAIVKTDIQIALPAGCYGRVAPRSGLAAKHFIDVGAGVIDEDYRGNVGVVLFNFGKESYDRANSSKQVLLEACLRRRSNDVRRSTSDTSNRNKMVDRKTRIFVDTPLTPR
nr:deoxyuridine 5'-triphosphate nucleotidohydrolase, mitochondrial [Anolis sagrei ordinatus]